MIHLLLLVVSLLTPGPVMECRRVEPTPEAKQYMMTCIESGHTNVQCYWTYWDAYQLGYGLEMPVVET